MAPVRWLLSGITLTLTPGGRQSSDAALTVAIGTQAHNIWTGVRHQSTSSNGISDCPDSPTEEAATCKRIIVRVREWGQEREQEWEVGKGQEREAAGLDNSRP